MRIVSVFISVIVGTGGCAYQRAQTIQDAELVGDNLFPSPGGQIRGNYFPRSGRF
jgi:hypothetical protein